MLRLLKNIFALLLFFFLAACQKEDDVAEVPEINIPEVVEPPTPTPTPQGQSVPLITSTPIPCENGFAGRYPCAGYDLINRVDLAQMGAEATNDNWGWTDTTTGKEYVLQGLDNGVAFLDISSPTQIKFLGKLPTATEPSVWRDIKVYNDHAYIVSEASGHGLQVFDLRRLVDLTAFRTFSADHVETSFGSAHNIAINESTGFAYVVGARKNNVAMYSGGPMFYDLSDPGRPTLVGGYQGSSYAHDAQIVTYNGPDTAHVGKEIYFGSHSDGGANNQIVIVDVSDKSNPVLITRVTYSNGGYTHQGWLDEDHRYFYLGDELDEYSYGHRTKTLVFDLADLENPVEHHNYYGPTNAIDHNGYVVGDALFLANYTAGFREIDISQIDNGQMQEVRYFDTFPANDSAGFDGVWNVYPFFESGLIAISETSDGLYLVHRSNE